MATVYAATPKKPAWPSDGSPVYPRRMSRLIARIAKIVICVSRPTQYELRNGGTAMRRTTRTTYATVCLPSAIQSRRLDGEDDDHRREEREVRQLRHERLAEIVEQADDDAADERAFQAAHPADDDDDKRQWEEIEIDARITAENGPTHHTAKRRQSGAGGEHEPGQQANVDTGSSRHLGIVDGRAQSRTNQRSFVQRPQQHADQGRHRNDEETINREDHLVHFQRPSQRRGVRQ